MVLCFRQPSATKLTDIVADSGRPVRLRFSCSIRAGSQEREQELTVTMDLKQALGRLNVVRLCESSGKLKSNFLAASILVSFLFFVCTCFMTCHDVTNLQALHFYSGKTASLQEDCIC